MKADFSESFHAALRALKSNKLRSILTAVGIIIGVAAVIVVVSLVQGLKHSVLKEVEKAGSQTLLIRPVMPTDVPYAEFTKIKNRDLTLDDMRELSHAVPQITQITPLFYNGTEVRSQGRSADATLIMTDETYLELNNINLQIGRNFVPSDLRLRNKVAILGSRVIEKLGITGNPIGQVVTSNSISLEIIGVLEEQGAALGNDPDSNILIPLTAGTPLLSDVQRRRLIMQARIDPRTTADDGAELAEEALRRIKGLREKTPAGFKIFSPKQITGIISNITGTITTVAVGMVSIALLVGGIGIMNIMLVSVTERTREIGVRKAVGAKRQDLLLQFLTEAVMISVLGGALGIAIGYIFGAAIGKALFGEVGIIPWWAMVAAFGVPAGIGIMFGIFPAAKAADLNPIDALRYE